MRFSPDTLDDCLGLIRFFEIEKALYELHYEINNRPDWVHVPLAGLVRLLQGVK